ncbi:hypothetical protein Tco_0746740 [Tanacetum coccineum]
MANLEFCDKHNMVAYLKKPTGSEGFQEIVDFLNGSHIRYALTKNPTIYVSLIKKFWQTATVRTVDNGEQEITATVDGKEFTVTEASVRRHLQLADVDGISVLPTTEIFDQLSLMGNMKRGFSEEHTPLFPSMLAIQAEEGEGSGHPSEPQPPPSTAQPTNEEPIPNVVSSSHQKTQTPRQALNQVTELPQTSEPIPNVLDEAVFEETQSTAIHNVPLPRGVGAGGSPRCQEAIGGSIAQTRSERVPTPPRDSPLPRVNTLRSDEGKRTAVASKPEYYRHQVQEVNISIPSSVVIKDKGKGIMEESEEEQSKRTKLQQEQDRLGHEAAVRLQEELDEEERQRMARVHAAAQSFTEEEWENIRARVEADEELTQRLQAEERNKYSEVDQANMLVDLINQRKRYFAAQKAEAKRNKPMTQAQQRNYMMNYIKHMGKTEDRGRASELATGSSQTTITDSAEVGSSKRGAEVGLDHEGSKKQKTNEASESVQEQPNEEEKELPQEDLQQMMMVVPVEEFEALQVKYPIIDGEVYYEDTRRYWRIIRVGNHTEAYQIFADMLNKFNRDDLVKLWDLVKERFSTTESTDDKEKELWVELKRLFEPDSDDTLWKLQRYMHDPLVWRLYDTCGVHHVSSVRGHDIFMLVEKDYPLSKGVQMLMLVNKLLVEQHSYGK